MFKFFKVGGCVRDELMGLQSKDIDYSVVADQNLLNKTTSAQEIFTLLEQFLTKQEYTIWLSTPDCFTIRAKFPDWHPNAGVTADFVLARKELEYVPGTRKPVVVAGTLYDDLERRDFTCNAIAKTEDGTLIDPFEGQKAIEAKTLITPLPTQKTFDDDPLRILRAIRFSITKGFFIPIEMKAVITGYNYKEKMPVVSEERIREELHKCFKHDSLLTMATLCDCTRLSMYIFDKTNLWLKPTNEK